MSSKIHEATTHIVIVGAGVCGLTCALALARQGYHIDVLDKRSNNDSESGRAQLAQAASLLAEVNRQPIDPKALPEKLQTIRDLQKPYWGVKERSVLLDTHTMNFLRSLEVDVSSVRRVESMLIEQLNGYLKFAVDLVAPSDWPTKGDLDPRRVILQRDFSFQPTLGQLEQLIRQRVEKIPQIRLHFDRRVLDVTETPSETSQPVRVNCADGSQYGAHYIVLADGGAASSLSKGVVTQKTVHTSEPISMAVFKAGTKDRLFGSQLDRSFSYSAFDSEHWLGAFCSGRNITIAVSDPEPTALASSEALLRLRALGSQADLVEPPFKVCAQIAIANRFTIGNRVLLAGDAAMTGNPRIGLGVQYAVFWAQKIDQLFEEARSTKAPPCVATYRARAMDMTERRKAFEAPWLASIDAYANDPASLSNSSIPAALLAAMEEFVFAADLDPRNGLANQAQLNTALRINFERIKQHCKSPLTDALHALSSLSVAASIQLDEPAISVGHGDGRGFVGHASLTPEHPMAFDIDTQQWSVSGGDISIYRVQKAWQFDLENLYTETICGEDTARSLGRSPLAAIRLTLPDELVNTMTGMSLTQLPATAFWAKPRKLCYELEHGAELAWGPLSVRTEGSTLLAMQIERLASGYPKVALSVRRGELVPMRFSRFAQHTNISSTRWLRSFGQILPTNFGPMIDSMIDTSTNLAGRRIRKIETRLLPDGGAIANFDTLMVPSIYLTPADLQQLQRSLMSATVLAELVEQTPTAIRRISTS